MNTVSIQGVFQVAAVGFMLVGASAAHAVTIYSPVIFDFKGGTGQQAASFNYTKPGLKLTVASNVATDPTAAHRTHSTVTAAGTVGRWPYGLGIRNGLENVYVNHNSSKNDDEHGSSKGEDEHESSKGDNEHNVLKSEDAHFVDGHGKNDVLSFFFSQKVRILSVTFAYNRRNDNFAFFFDKSNGKDGSLTNDLVWKSKDIPGDSFYGTYSFLTLNAPSYIGRLFGIGAFGDGDQFKVASITVQQVSSVPLPAALPLLLASLGGLGWFGRRKFSAVV